MNTLGELAQMQYIGGRKGCTVIDLESEHASLSPALADYLTELHAFVRALVRENDEMFCLLTQMDDYLSSGSSATAIYQSSIFHRDIAKLLEKIK